MTATSQSQSDFTTDGQSASLSWCQATIRAHDQFFFLLEIFFRQLRVCYFVAPSLTRGRACNSLFLLILTSAVPRAYFIVPILQTPQPQGQVPVFISTRNRVAQIYHRALGSLSVSSSSSSSRYIATDGQSASSSWCRAPNGALDQILISLFDSY
jgi:hypothetical protein